jgi:hypothetical protein
MERINAILSFVVKRTAQKTKNEGDVERDTQQGDIISFISLKK